MWTRTDFTKCALKILQEYNILASRLNVHSLNSAWIETLKAFLVTVSPEFLICFIHFYHL